jgi:hypothetical protein
MAGARRSPGFPFPWEDVAQTDAVGVEHQQGPSGRRERHARRPSDPFWKAPQAFWPRSIRAPLSRAQTKPVSGLHDILHATGSGDRPEAAPN